MQLKQLFLSLSLVIFSLWTQNSWAANGAHLTAISSASKGMGGVSVGRYLSGMDGLYRNPATLTQSKTAVGGIQLEGGVQIAQLLGKANTGAGDKESSDKSRIIPDVGMTYRLTDDLTTGLAVVTYGGVFNDYVGETSISEIKTDGRSHRLMLGAGYQVTENLSLGVTPFMNYSTLSLNLTSATTGLQSTRSANGAVAFGGTFGLHANVVENLSVGASYSMKTNLKIKELVDLDGFGPGTGSAVTAGALDDVTIQEPDEVNVGVAFQATEDLILAVDYRLKRWAASETFNDLGWTDQHVIALGAQYQMGEWALRSGVNYGKSPIEDKTGQLDTPVVDMEGHTVFPSSVTLLNMASFPAISEWNLSAGVGWAVSSALDLDMAFVYSPSKTVSHSGTNFASAAYTRSGTMAQWSLGMNAAYRF